MKTEQLLATYKYILMSRKMDELEASLAQRGEVPFYVPCTGHEATAAIAHHLTEDDWFHGHYRDKALLLARGILPGAFFASILGKDTSTSRGRRMPGFVSNPALNILSPCTVVGNSALQAAGVAAAVKERPGQPLVLCSVGDGATQQGEYLEAIAECVRNQLPVLFLVQDNHFALSTRTEGNTFFSLPSGDADEFYGLKLRRVNGRDPVEVCDAFAEIVSDIRQTRTPQIAVLNIERLSSHTNADDQAMYRDEEELKLLRQTADPLKNLTAHLLQAGIAQEQLDSLETEIEAEISEALATVRNEAEPGTVLETKRPLPEPERTEEYRGTEDNRTVTMLEAMRGVLANQMRTDSSVSLCGEDIEDPKGDVFGLTRGLSTEFPEQVRNSALTESTIVGTAIGRSLVGERPVALVQFADFLPLAFNQIFSELGSMYWRTAGNWDAPVLVMSICGGYRPGLGPYHAQTPAALLAHIPGIDVLCPATAADAAGLLNASFATRRPAVFLYPKSLINDRSLTTSADLDKHFVPIGKGRITREGQDLTIVSWGSTMPICEKTADALAEVGLAAEIIDLRSISPWDKDMVLSSARKTNRLLVVHEDNSTCGVGSEILATTAEQSGQNIDMARVAQADTYVPYHFGAQLKVLPSFRSVLTKAADMLELDISWEETIKEEAGHIVVNAIGSSPSDETVTITTLHSQTGDEIAEGGLIASVEADKATMEISAPVAGTVAEILLSEGDTVRVGTPLARIATSQMARATHLVSGDTARPLLEKRRPDVVAQPTTSETPVLHTQNNPVIISSICHAVGSRVIENEELVKSWPDWEPKDIVKRTGIERRFWISEDETALSLALNACHKLFEREQIGIEDFDAIICSTGTPPATTPSLACRILKELSPDTGELLMQAHDINAACSGYLYALQEAHDMLQYNPEQKILIVTAETLSPVLNHKDPDTLFLFGDAATASLISCEQRNGNINCLVNRPELSALGEEEKTLFVPALNSGLTMQMKGKPVFRIAVRKMIDMLNKACAANGIGVNDLSMIVPHQANERIIEAIRKAIKFPTDKVFYYIREYGNTSSNTIPLSLEALLPNHAEGKVGLTAFGGGFTFGAAVLDVLPQTKADGNG